MNKSKNSIFFLLLCLVASLLIVYFVIKPFFGPLILAAVFAFLFQPLYRRILRMIRKKQGLASFATIAITTVIVLLPMLFIGSQFFREASQFYDNLVSGRSNFVGTIESFVNKLTSSLLIPGDFTIDLNQYSRQFFSLLTQSIGGIFSGLVHGTLNIFVFFLAYYYLLKDGGKLKDYLVKISPLEDGDDELVVSRIKSAVVAVTKGNLLIGLIQGVLTITGFFLFGVPSPILWGSMAAITALIPGIGTAVVITPAIIFLFLTGNTFGAVGLLIWGVLAIGLVDDFLGPKLVGRGMRLHPLAAFLAVIGGLALFGPLGFLLGPLSLGICMTLIEIYFSKTKLKGAK